MTNESVLIPENSSIYPWYLGETGERWMIAVRRFAPIMMPHPLVARVEAIDDASLPGITAPAIILWELPRDALLAVCDRLATVAATSPGTLQLVGGRGLTNRERIVLSEMRCAACIRHPEELPGLTPMIHGYFATALKRLD